MKSKNILLTGATSGIGNATAKALVEKKANLIFLARNKDRAEQTKQELLSLGKNTLVEYIICDLSSMESVHNAVEEYKSKYDNLDVLINCAGTMQGKRLVTDEGFEFTIAVNYFAPFLLSNGLLDLLKKSESARIINVTSGLAKNSSIDLEDLQSEKKFKGMDVYSMTKLLDIIFTYSLHEKLREENNENISVNVMHPGLVKTNLGRDSSFIQRFIFNNFVTRFMGNSVEEGADTIVYLTTSDEISGVSGKYWAKREQLESSEVTYNKEIQKELWSKTEELLKAYRN